MNRDKHQTIMNSLNLARVGLLMGSGGFLSWIFQLEFYYNGHYFAIVSSENRYNTPLELIDIFTTY